LTFIFGEGLHTTVHQGVTGTGLHTSRRFTVRAAIAAIGFVLFQVGLGDRRCGDTEEDVCQIGHSAAKPCQ
jgi:hypothetical protein